MRTLLLTWILACGRADPDPEPLEPAVAVVVPLSGEGATRGEAVLSAARAALEDSYAVVAIDETRAAAIEEAQRNPAVVAALAHISPGAADRGADAWLAGDVPVIALSAGKSDRLPRAVANQSELARCSAALVTGRRVTLVHDGSSAAMSMVSPLQERLGSRASALLAIDPGDMATDVGRLMKGRTDEIVYVGGLSLGGDLLRALRAQGSRIRFLAVGGSAEEFFDAAGAGATDARVVSPDRVPFMAQVLRSFEARQGGAPSGSARNAYDAATVLRAALDVVPRDARGLPPRGEVRAAFDQVIGVGVGGPLALVEGRPSPLQCTGYAKVAGALVVDAAAQVGADQVPVRLDLKKATQ